MLLCIAFSLFFSKKTKTTVFFYHNIIFPYKEWLMQKVPDFRSKYYRQYVAQLPCCVTGRTGEMNDPHHIKGRGYGSSTKCSDLFCIPITHELHQEFHQIGWRSFEKKYNICQVSAVLKTIERAFADGVLNES